MSSTQAILWWPWVNHSTNVFSGTTFTVPAASGVLIISALTILVRMAGEGAWKITAFMLHHLRSGVEPEDALSRQLQVYLRNSGTSFGSVLELSKIGWAWKGKAHNGMMRSLGLVWLALSIALSFTAAGILVGKVAVPAYEINQILLNPTNCGLESEREGISNVNAALYDVQAKHTNDMRQARAYASACYNATNTTAECTSLPVQQLPYTVNTAAACPFANRCRLGLDSAVQLDTGVLDSHNHLGINAKLEDRVGFRVSTTCSPIRAADLTKAIPDERSNGNFSIFQVYFGPIPGAANYTWQYVQMQAFQHTPYTLDSYVYYTGIPNSSWTLIPDLALQNADTSLLFFSANSVWYYGPSFDPIFSANGTYIETLADGTEYYVPDYYFATLACADQLQLCNSATGACGTLTGNHITGYDTLGLNDIQQATAERIILARLRSHMYDAANGQGGAALAANDLLFNLFSPQLPSDQWIREATQMFQTLLANIQLRIVDFPTNSWYTNDTQNIGVIAASDWQETDAPAMNDLCRRQRVMSTDQYQSFSLAGVLLVAVLCPALILTAWFLESCVQTRKELGPNGSKRYRRLAWIADGKLQLLRLALKDAGYVGWSKQMEDVPVRAGGDDILPPIEEDDAVLYRRLTAPEQINDGMVHEMEPLYPKGRVEVA